MAMLHLLFQDAVCNSTIYSDDLEFQLRLLHAGNSANAAYLANVCVAQSARRQGVGGALIQAARQNARIWG